MIAFKVQVDYAPLIKQNLAHLGRRNTLCSYNGEI